MFNIRQTRDKNNPEFFYGKISDFLLLIQKNKGIFVKMQNILVKYKQFIAKHYKDVLCAVLLQRFAFNHVFKNILSLTLQTECKDFIKKTPNSIIFLS